MLGLVTRGALVATLVLLAVICCVVAAAAPIVLVEQEVQVPATPCLNCERYLIISGKVYKSYYVLDGLAVGECIPITPLGKKYKSLNVSITVKLHKLNLIVQTPSGNVHKIRSVSIHDQVVVEPLRLCVRLLPVALLVLDNNSRIIAWENFTGETIYLVVPVANTSVVKLGTLFGVQIALHGNITILHSHEIVVEHIFRSGEKRLSIYSNETVIRLVSTLKPLAYAYTEYVNNTIFAVLGAELARHLKLKVLRHIMHRVVKDVERHIREAVPTSIEKELVQRASRLENVTLAFHNLTQNIVENLYEVLSNEVLNELSEYISETELGKWLHSLVKTFDVRRLLELSRTPRVLYMFAKLGNFTVESGKSVQVEGSRVRGLEAKAELGLNLTLRVRLVGTLAYFTHYMHLQLLREIRDGLLHTLAKACESIGGKVRAKSSEHVVCELVLIGGTERLNLTYTLTPIINVTAVGIAENETFRIETTYYNISVKPEPLHIAKTRYEYFVLGLMPGTALEIVGPSRINISSTRGVYVCNAVVNRASLVVPEEDVSIVLKYSCSLLTTKSSGLATEQAEVKAPAVNIVSIEVVSPELGEDVNLTAHLPNRTIRFKANVTVSEVPADVNITLIVRAAPGVKLVVNDAERTEVVLSKVIRMTSKNTVVTLPEDGAVVVILEPGAELGEYIVNVTAIATAGQSVATKSIRVETARPELGSVEVNMTGTRTVVRIYLDTKHNIVFSDLAHAELYVYMTCEGSVVSFARGRYVVAGKTSYIEAVMTVPLDVLTRSSTCVIRFRAAKLSSLPFSEIKLKVVPLSQLLYVKLVNITRVEENNATHIVANFEVIADKDAVTKLTLKPSSPVVINCNETQLRCTISVDLAEIRTDLYLVPETVICRGKESNYDGYICVPEPVLVLRAVK